LGDNERVVAAIAKRFAGCPGELAIFTVAGQDCDVLEIAGRALLERDGNGSSVIIRLPLKWICCSSSDGGREFGEEEGGRLSGREGRKGRGREKNRVDEAHVGCSRILQSSTGEKASRELDKECM